jgi:hypothetical protein
MGGEAPHSLLKSGAVSIDTAVIKKWKESVRTGLIMIVSPHFGNSIAV